MIKHTEKEQDREATPPPTGEGAERKAALQTLAWFLLVCFPCKCERTQISQQRGFTGFCVIY